MRWPAWTLGEESTFGFVWWSAVCLRCRSLIYMTTKEQACAVRKMAACKPGMSPQGIFAKGEQWLGDGKGET